MFDVFYIGIKPGLFAHEREADSLEQAAEMSRTKYYWCIYGDNDYTNFDFDYIPPPWESDHLHTWPTQWHQFGGAYLANKDTVHKKNYNFKLTVVKLLPNKENWIIPDNIDSDAFDWSWKPHPMDPPYLYHFGTQWQRSGGPIFKKSGATVIKYVTDSRARSLPSQKFWKCIHEIKDFDFSWHPDPTDPPYIYVFGNQWYGPEQMPTVEYHVPGATERKYLYEPQAALPVTHDNWIVNSDVPVEFDFSWCPDPHDPPYIYQFGNQWYPAEEMPTVEYRMPGATEIKYVDSLQAKMLPAMDRWNIPEEIDATNIDFSWVPHPKDDPYIHHFGSEYQISTGLTYTVPGATEPKFEGEPPSLIKEKSTVAVVDIFYVDRGNALSADRYKKLQEKYPNIQKIRYANSMLDTVRRCVTRARTRKFWVVSSLNVYDDFDFAWHAEPWQNYMTHVFPSQWNKWSDTFLINKWEFEKHSKWARGIEEFPNLNFVKNLTVQSSSDGSNIYYVDHGNANNQLAWLQEKYSKIKITRFVDNYLDTFKRIMATADTEYIWIVSSICNYDSFDFTWHPEAWQSEMIHVFASGPQRRGDTFYIHVESFKAQMYELELLDWFNVINYCEDQKTYRLEAPTIVYDGDSLIEPVKNTQFNFPYAIFMNSSDNVYPTYGYPCLWAAKDRVVIPLTANKSSSLIPREARGSVVTQIYDYPYIQKENDVVYASRPLDIIFISNGEPDEQMMFEHTQYMTDSDVKWIRGVNGRVAAYQAAARASETPWFFAVFAKLEVVGNTFPWYDWQPDYFQEPKHYIFNARNPVNGLVYGHQGMIAYNKQLVLANNTPGIDFTLSQPHESVPILSGTARFNQDPWTTWRTAFREVVKLKHFMAVQPTLETEHRLDTWLTVADGDHAEWCLRGAADAVEYYTEVTGEYSKLMLSFEWAWLWSRFKSLYNV